MFIIFALPVSIAAVALPRLNKLNFATNKAHGLLINNPYKIQINSAKDLHNNFVTNTAIAKNKWRVIYVQTKSCQQQCISNLQLLQKLHLALGAQQKRVAIYTIHGNSLLPQIKQESIIIINPADYYVMQHAVDADYSLLLKDLRRLLKYSHAN